MKCHTSVSSTTPTQLPHTFPYIVATLIHNHFESPNTCYARILIAYSLKNILLIN
jgi:hypothetical protein